MPRIFARPVEIDDLSAGIHGDQSAPHIAEDLRGVQTDGMESLRGFLQGGTGLGRPFGKVTRQNAHEEKGDGIQASPQHQVETSQTSAPHKAREICRPGEEQA